MCVSTGASINVSTAANICPLHLTALILSICVGFQAHLSLSLLILIHADTLPDSNPQYSSLSCRSSPRFQPFVLILADPDVRRAGKPLDPIQAASLFYAGYNVKIPLSSTEKRALHTLVACRLALSFTFGMYSAAQDPQNEYTSHHMCTSQQLL